MAIYLTIPTLKHIHKQLFLYFWNPNYKLCNLHTSPNFIFSFRIYNTFSYLLKFADFTSRELVFALPFFLHAISTVSRNITNVSFFSSLNKIDSFIHYHKFVRKDNAKNQSSVFIQQSCKGKRCGDKHCTTVSLIKVPSLDVVVNLVLEVHNMLFTARIYAANEWNVKCQSPY